MECNLTAVGAHTLSYGVDFRLVSLPCILNANISLRVSIAYQGRTCINSHAQYGFTYIYWVKMADAFSGSDIYPLMSSLFPLLFEEEKNKKNVELNR